MVLFLLKFGKYYFLFDVNGCFKVVYVLLFLVDWFRGKVEWVVGNVTWLDVGVFYFWVKSRNEILFLIVFWIVEKDWILIFFGMLGWGDRGLVCEKRGIVILLNLGIRWEIYFYYGVIRLVVWGSVNRRGSVYD